jgi:hypothetical protein
MDVILEHSVIAPLLVLPEKTNPQRIQKGLFGYQRQA